MSAPGIDVASYQGSPNWQSVKNSGVQFVYIKASEGSSSSYPSLNSQYAGAVAAGLVTGFYHYAKPGLSPEANADAFAAQINRLGAKDGHLPPCLDLEEGSGYLGDWAKAFVARLRLKTGIQRVCVYSGGSFFQTQITERWMDPDIMLWIAHYGRPAGQPGYLTPRVAVHQFSSTGAVPGIGGNVDLNFPVWPLATILGGGSSPAVTTTPTAAPGREEEDIMDIEIDMAANGQFRGGAMCECGEGSALYDHGWITYGVLWGGSADIKITFLARGGPMQPPTVLRGVANNNDAGVAIPSGCRMVTVEGQASSGSVKVLSSRVRIPR